MGLRTKFNVLLVFAFSIGLVATGLVSHRILQENARQEVIQKARIIMENAIAIRSYTVREIRPLLKSQMEQQFLPQSVSAYAAMENFRVLRSKFPHYTYKEAALNPINPVHRATDWEADIIQAFRNNVQRRELVVERDTPVGRVLNLARPLQVKDEGCLQCHGKPEAAPGTLISLYGTANGFGWKLHEIVGSQIVSVPMSVPLKRAQQTFIVFLGVLSIIFCGIMVLLNILLHRTVIKPVLKIAEVANEVSMGNMNYPIYAKTGTDEIASLSTSFNRMRRSLDSAMVLLEE